MKLIIMRHGQTFGNLYGHINTWEADLLNYLTPVGVQQTSEAKLPKIEFKRYYVSQFNRSRQTMMYLLHANKLVIDKDISCIQERNDINEWCAWEQQHHVIQRAIDFLTHLKSTPDDGNVLAVSHGIYMQFILKAVGLPIQSVDHQGQFPHCVPVEIDYDLIAKAIK